MFSITIYFYWYVLNWSRVYENDAEKDQSQSLEAMTALHYFLESDGGNITALSFKAIKLALIDSNHRLSYCVSIKNGGTSQMYFLNLFSLANAL